MSYFVLCTFDLKNATRQDYDNAYADLENLGLKKVIVSDQGGKVVIPTTTVAGTYTGSSAGAVRDSVCEKVKKAFTARRLVSETFVLVGGDWAWSVATTG
jgi:hypothetical protein